MSDSGTVAFTGGRQNVTVATWSWRSTVTGRSWPQEGSGIAAVLVDGVSPGLGHPLLGGFGFCLGIGGRGHGGAGGGLSLLCRGGQALGAALKPFRIRFEPAELGFGLPPLGFGLGVGGGRGRPALR